MDDIWNHLKKGNECVQIPTKKNVALVLSDYEIEKDGIVHFITGNKRLVSKKNHDNLGGYKITDESKESSHKIYPETLIDEETNTLYYNHPGFHNRVNSSIDLVSTYFTKKLIEQSNEMKLLFVIDYSWITDATKQKNFTNFIENLGLLITNIEKFQNSIFLIVINVKNNTNNPNDLFVPDKAVINNIKGFLQLMKNEVQSESGRRLLNTLTTTRSESCENLHIFRSPNTPGHLDKMETLKDNRKIVKRMIDQCLEFTPTSDGDLNWKVTGNSQIFIENIFQQIKSNITSKVESITTKVWNFCVEKQNQMDDLLKLYDQLNKGTDAFQTMLETINAQTTLQDFIIKLENLLEPLNISSLRDDLIEIFVQDQNYQLLKFITGNQLNINLLPLIKPLNSTLKNLNDSYIWCGFLLRLYNDLTRYDLLLDKTKNNFTLFIQDLESIRNSHSKLTSHEFKAFFQQLSSCFDLNCLGYDSLVTIIIDDNRFNMLKKLIHRIFNEDQFTKTYHCYRVNNEYLIDGRYLKLTDIDWTDPCLGTAKLLTIFSRNKIFIDADVAFNSRYNKVTIISPEWEIVGSRTVTVDTEFLGIGYTFNEGINLSIKGPKNPKRLQFFELNDVSGIIAQFDESSVAIGESGCKSQAKYINESITRIEDNLFHPRRNVFTKSIFHNLHLLTRYKKKLFDRLNDPMDKLVINQMLNGLNRNVCIRSWYNPWDFIEELLHLENHYQDKYKKDIIPMYESLLERIEFHARDNIESDKVILTYAYTATWSKLWSIKNDLKNNLVLEVEGYLDHILSQVEDVGRNTKIIAINEMNVDQNEAIDTTIKEIIDFINNHLTKELNDTNKNTEVDIKTLLSEVRNKRTGYENIIEYQQSQATKLQILSGVKISCVILTAIGFVAMAFGPIGLAIGAGLILSSTVGYGVTEFFGEPPTIVPEIPDAVKQIDHAQDRIRERLFVNKKKAFEAQMSLIEEGVKEYPDELSDVKRTLNGIKNNSDMIDTKMVQVVLTRALSKIKDSGKGGQRIQKVIELIEKTRMIPIVSGLVEDVKFWRKDNERASELENNVINNATKYIEQLNSYEDEIEEMLLPMMQDARNWMEVLLNNLHNQSGLSLDFTKWSIQNKLRNIKKFMRSFTQGFRMQQHVIDHWDKMEEVIDHMIDAYDRINDLKNQKRLVNYIAQMKMTNLDGLLMENQHLKQDVSKVQRIIQYHTILGQYNRVLGSLKQSVFPFASFYLKEGELPENVTSNGDIIDNLKQKLNNLKTNFVESRTALVSDVDTDIILTTFSPANVKLKNPFYVWYNQDNRAAIKKLFTGMEIVLKADIAKMKVKNAVKFSKVEILFTSNNHTVQNEMNDLLKDFAIHMTHMGVSNYRCGYKSYKIVSGSQYFYYTFAKDREGKPLRQNRAYEKLSKFKPVLSPYAMWTFKLEGMKNARFDRLMNYEDLVHLELVGSGTFIADNAKICYDELERYYDFDQNLLQTSQLYNEQSQENSKRYRRRVDYIDYNDTTKPPSYFPWISNDQRNKNQSFHLANNRPYSTDGTLMLLQYGIRNITGSKLGELNFQEHQTKFDNAFLRSTNITLRFEKQVKNLCKKHHIPMNKSVFDPVALNNELKINILNGNCEKCRNILYNAVVPPDSLLFTDEFQQDLKYIIFQLFSS